MNNEKMNAIAKENLNPFAHEIIMEEVGSLLHVISIVAFYDLDVNLMEKMKGPNLWSWSSLLAVLAKLGDLCMVYVKKGVAGQLAAATHLRRHLQCTSPTLVNLLSPWLGEKTLMLVVV
jgi:hypothetical protein